VMLQYPGRPTGIEAVGFSMGFPWGADSRAATELLRMWPDQALWVVKCAIRDSNPEPAD
jgi:hypothetical protein